MLSIKQMLILVFLLALIIPASAQDEDYGVQTFSSPDGVILMLGRDILHPSTAAENNGWIGYNIYRKESGESEYDKINSKPLSRIDSMDELEEKLGIKTQFAIKFLGLETSEEFWDLLVKGDERIQLISVIDLNYREVLGLYYRDLKVKPGITYSYVITKVDAGGKESPRSQESIVTYGETPYSLKGPIEVKGSADDKKAELEWQVNPADTAVFAYAIYRSTNPEGPFDKLNDKPIMLFYQDDQNKPSKGSFTDNNIKEGIMYYYAVVSVDIAGNESSKEPLIKILPRDRVAPSVPQNFRAETGKTGIVLLWDVGDEADLAGYNVYRSIYADSNFTKINRSMVPPDTGLYNDYTALASVQYYYRITAIDRSGNESVISARALMVFENKRGPMPPQSVQAEGTDEGIMINWAANTESDLRGYYVFRGESSGDDPVQVSPLIPLDTLQYLDIDNFLSPKGNYWYYVKAINFSGHWSNYSLPATASPDINIVPEPPLSFFGYQDVKGNRLFWDLPFDNSVTGYNVYRSEESDNLIWTKIIANPLTFNTRKYTDTTAVTGVTYLYHIKSVNDKGIESRQSHNITLNLFAPPPLSPGNIMVTPVDGGLKISWDPSMENDAVGYNLYRRIPGQKIEKLSGDMLTIDNSQYIDNNVNAGQRYFYSVSCVDNQGREGLRSSEQNGYIR